MGQGDRVHKEQGAQGNSGAGCTGDRGTRRQWDEGDRVAQEQEGRVPRGTGCIRSSTLLGQCCFQTGQNSEFLFSLLGVHCILSGDDTEDDNNAIICVKRPVDDWHIAVLRTAQRPLPPSSHKRIS